MSGCGDDGASTANSASLGGSGGSGGSAGASGAAGSSAAAGESGSAGSSGSAGASGSAGEAGSAGGGGSSGNPSVSYASKYQVEVSTHTYAQGLTRGSWAEAGGSPKDLLLDLYEPKGAPGLRPALVVIHGGGFIGGSRTAATVAGFAKAFAERGWVAISIDYRLVADHGSVPMDWQNFVQMNVAPGNEDQPMALYPAARDAKAVIRWLYSQTSTYQIDTSRVTALGGSAGSFLAIMAGVSDPEDYRDEIPASDDSTLATTHLNAGSAVHTIIDHWGGVAHLGMLKAVWGRDRYDAMDPPVSIVHGTADPTVPFSQAEALRDAYIATGAPSDFHPLDGLGHGPWNAKVNGKSLQELAFDFMVKHQNLTVENEADGAAEQNGPAQPGTNEARS